MTNIITKPSKDYELLDSGNGQKLERFGGVVVARPDPQALWPKRLSETEWSKADATFEKGDAGEKGSWKTRKTVPEKWDVSFDDLTFVIKPTPFKHVGIFPEQAENWQWMKKQITKAMKADHKMEINVLNLFGYTGGATLACAEAGAHVTHVDASKAAITWANENATASHLESRPIRWILEDALAFVKKEAKRGKKYDAIVMDPPAFGRGSKGEVWKIEEKLLPLLEACFATLSDKPLFFIINGYAAGYSSLAYENNLKVLVEKYGGTLESGELAILESENKAGESRVLPCGIFSRWS